MLSRKIETEIESHLISHSNKILLIDGARQVGKTFIIKHVGPRLFTKESGKPIPLGVGWIALLFIF